MAGNASTLHLILPEQSLSSLTFCDVSAKSVRNWAAALPMANIGETARRLYHAIIELNQLDTSPQQRLTMLEPIRQPIYYVCEGLSRHYLGHSISLPEKQRKVANLAQALQLHLAGGYKQALIDLVRRSDAEKNRQLIALSAHRAMSDLSSTILRAAQLYCPSPTHSWLECHRIFRFINTRQLTSLSIEDRTNAYLTATTLADTYKRLLLLGCCRPNQLRQSELSQVYGLFECWARLSEFSAEHLSEALFIVDTERDAPPIYRSLITEPLNRDFFGFDTTELSHRLSETQNRLRNSAPNSLELLELPVKPTEPLLLHLSQALGILTKRNFKRHPNSGQLCVSLGMSAAHYYSTERTDFSHFLGTSEAWEPDPDIFLNRARRRQDAWSSAHDAGPAESTTSPDTPIVFRGARGNVVDGRERGAGYPHYRVPLLNTSPGGYCLHWNEAVPAAMQAGELLAVREQDDYPWSPAIIRWIRQVRQQGTQVGVELLAPGSTPCAVRLIQKKGHNSEYLRALLLPELGSIGQPATLITPRVPFQVGNRVVLFVRGGEEECLLSRRVSATGSISQFELKFLSRSDPEKGTIPSAKGVDSTEEDFDSLWPSL